MTTPFAANACREVMIRKITRWKQGDQAPKLAGKALDLTHIKIMVQDGGLHQVTFYDVKVGDDPIDLTEWCITEAEDHASGYRAQGIVPTYFAHFHFGGQNVKTHEIPIPVTQIEDGSPSTALVASGVSDLRRRDNQENIVISQAVKLTEMHANAALTAQTNCIATMSGLLEKALTRIENVESRMDAMRAEREDLLDRSADREIRVLGAKVKLKIQAAVADVGLTALPAFVAIGARKLNAAAGITPEPLDARVGRLFERFAATDTDKLNKALDDLGFTAAEKAELYSIYREAQSKKAIENLERNGGAASNGVTSRMPTRLNVLPGGKAAPKQMKSGGSSGTGTGTYHGPFR